MKENLEIKVKSKEVLGKDGVKYTVFSALTKKGWTDIRFTKDCELVPAGNCIITVKNNSDAFNINSKAKFPIIYVKKVSALTELPKTYFDNKVEDYFDLD